mgnify:CR=1 FL=1
MSFESHDAAHPGHARAQAATLDDALKLLLARCRSDVAATPPKLSPATLTMYEQKAGTLGRTLGLALPLRDLTPARVDAHIAARREEHVTDHTIHKELTTLRQALALLTHPDGDIALFNDAILRTAAERIAQNIAIPAETIFDARRFR